MIVKTRPRRALLGAAAALLAVATLQPPAAAQAQPEPDTQTPGEAYASMGFGIFMHYGLATFVGGTPWSYDPRDVPATVYDPPNFDPDQWMDAIAASGANYIIFTAKHHDGFAMWPSDYTDYDVANSSAPETDVVGEVVRAARDHGLEVVLYYSWYDKLQPGGDVRPRNPNSDRTTDSPEYMAYVKNQLRELLTDYGHIQGIWLDIAPMDDVQLPELADFVHTVSPGTALVPNFPSALLDTEAADVRTFEGPYEIMPCGYAGKPAEQAFNVSAGPGWWQMSDAPPRRDADGVLTELAVTQTMGATLSLNVSPGPSGLMPPASVQLLEAVGDRVRGDLLDDTSSAAEYTGHWQAHARPAGMPDDVRPPGWVPWAGAFNGTIHRSRKAGDTATFEFTGTGVRLHTAVGPHRGTARVTVDGGEPELIDTYRAEPGSDTVTYERTDLEPGEHTVTVEVTGEQHDDSTGSWVTIDRVTPLVLPSASAEPEALPDGRLIYDDGVSRCGGEEGIHYVGAWSSGSWDGAHNGTRHYSRSRGAYAELTFTGTGVAVMTQARPGHGIAAISLDGGEPELVDTYSNPPREQVIVWQKTGLPPGEHTVRVTVTGDKNPAARRNWVAVDAIIVTP